MEFLKEKLGEELYNQVAEKLKDSGMKLADLSTGAYVGKEKFDAQAEKLKLADEQLKAANKQIAEFKDMDVDGIKAAAGEWKGKAEQAEKDAAAKIQAMEFDYALSGALTAAKVKNPKALKALLDLDGLKHNNGEIVGLNEQLEKIKESDGYLFESEEKAPYVVKGTSGGAPASVTKEAFEKMSYLDKLKLKTEQPEVFKLLLEG